MYLAAMLLSLAAAVLSVHRYNERGAASVLTVLVTAPFTLATVASRTAAAAIILAFYPGLWSLALFSALAAALLVTNSACEVSSRAPEAGSSWAGAGWRLVRGLPGRTARALVSILAPLGYNNDR